jgi:hypothetical protein
VEKRGSSIEKEKKSMETRTSDEDREESQIKKYGKIPSGVSII